METKLLIQLVAHEFVLWTVSPAFPNCGVCVAKKNTKMVKMFTIQKLLLSPPWNVWSGSIRSLSSSCKKFQVSTPVLKLEVSARPKHQQSRLLSSKWRDFFHNSGVMKLITPRLYGIFKNNCFLIDAFLLFFVPFQTPAPLAGRSFPPRTTTRNKATNNERQTTKNNTSKE